MTRRDGRAVLPAAMWLLAILLWPGCTWATSWWTARKPSQWHSQLGFGLAMMPFDVEWNTTAPQLDGLGVGGVMGALGLRGGLGWTHPSGQWGLDLVASGGPRVDLFGPGENSGSFLASQLAVRWDPFAAYQIAPICGVGATLSSATQHVLDYTVGFGSWNDPQNTLGSVDQERLAFSLGLTSGFRAGWFEVYVDMAWPLLSRNSHSMTSRDSSWSGTFERTHFDNSFQLGYLLRIPIVALDGGVWGMRREEFQTPHASGGGIHAFSMGVEVFRVPAAWSFHTELDDASAVCYGQRMRWDLSLPSPSAQGIVLGLFHGVSTGDGSSQSTSFRGADAGLWWDPFPEKAVALRLAGTLGYWSADASADFRHHADSVVIQADWWGVRTSVGARILLSLGYVGGRVDLDLVHPGELQRNELAPNPDRSNRLAVGGGLEAGLLYRY